MKKMLISIFVLSSMIILTSCGVSPEEKEQRRANAFDISGQYQLNSSQLDRGEVSLDIVNESDRSNFY
jgi:predicted oxidoreductase